MNATKRPQEPDEAFVIAFNRLAVALRLPDLDPAMIGVYFAALSDLSAETLRAGADVLMSESGRRFFPTAGEWRAQAELARDRLVHATVVVLNADDPRGWVCCPRCQDTGWVLADDGGALRCGGTSICGRTRAHLPHTYTEVCGCRASNVNWQRRLQGIAR